MEKTKDREDLFKFFKKFKTELNQIDLRKAITQISTIDFYYLFCYIYYLELHAKMQNINIDHTSISGNLTSQYEIVDFSFLINNLYKF